MTAEPRKLNRAHFAFMRAVVQGMDVRSSWDRYVAIEGKATDLRRVQSTIAWIRQAFAAAAKRHARPGTARLVLIDVDEVEEAANLPTLAEFAAARGMEDFSGFCRDSLIRPTKAAGPTSIRKPASRTGLLQTRLGL